MINNNTTSSTDNDTSNNNTNVQPRLWQLGEMMVMTS